MADKRKETACFTGHRDISGLVADTVAERTRQAVVSLIEKGYRYFGAGGARGFDALAAETVLKLQAIYPYIRLILVLPFRDQYRHEKGWTRAEIAQYHSLQERAAKVVILAEEYSSGVYYRRNKHLVNWSSVCIAYMTSPNTGTSYTVNYARSKGLQIINTALER